MATTSSSVSSSVVEAVAEESNTDPSDLPEQLADVIDPDALDRLFYGRDVDGRVQFEFCSYLVTVRSDGAVTTEPAINGEQDNEV